MHLLSLQGLLKSLSDLMNSKEWKNKNTKMAVLG